MTQTLLFEQHSNGVAVITFNRPDALNALNLATMQQFAETVTHLNQATESLRAVILTGAGTQAFCSGGDLVELSRYPSQDDARAFITLMGNALLMLERLPVPVIGAINGYALGGGSEIALACDLRIADESVRLGFVQIKNAVIPGWGGGQRLLRLVGYSRALELLVTARPLSAAEAHTLGLVNRVVGTGAALEHAVEMAEKIAAQPPDVVRAIKALLQAGLTQPYEDALRLERDLFPPLWAAEAHLQAVENFLNRRK
ncbi:MAG: enoyl-CoA hydratase/isomerase family protein [bacterium]|nr:enoyl-CoA hydratase/isomerase family protein [bacterium]